MHEKKVSFSIKNLNKISTAEPTEQQVATEPTKVRKATKAKTKCKISSLKSHEDFSNKLKMKKTYE